MTATLPIGNWAKITAPPGTKVGPLTFTFGNATKFQEYDDKGYNLAALGNYTRAILYYDKKLFRVTVYMWPVVVGKIFSLLLPILCCISANTCDDMGRTATINKNAAIEITITAIVKPFCLINIKLIIINLLIKKALSRSQSILAVTIHIIDD